MNATQYTQSTGRNAITNLKIAVIGCGYWGVHYTRIFRSLEGSELRAVCEANATRRNELAQRYPGLDIESDLNRLLAREDVDAVVIATEARSHHAIARQALLAGKHVLVEKPLALDSGDCRELGRLAGQLGLTLMVGHTFIFNPGVKLLRTLLESGSVGKLHYLYAQRSNLGPIRNDVSAVWDLAPHDISIFNYLLDSTPSWVSATGGSFLRADREDVAFVAMGYPDGTVAHIHVSWADPEKTRKIVLVGSEGRAAFNDTATTNTVEVVRTGVTARPDESSRQNGSLTFGTGAVEYPEPDKGEPLLLQSMHFLDCIREGARPLTSAEAGTAVVLTLEAIGRSLRAGGEKVPVADPGVDISIHQEPVSAHIPLVDLGAQHRSLANEIEGAMAAVIKRGDYILGEDVQLFEEEFAAYCGVRHAVGVDSGTSAIDLSLRALGIGPGDEVIVPANTFIASVLPITELGATPVLVDVDPTTLNLTRATVERHITDRTRAVLPVHLYGNPAPMLELRSLCDRHGLLLIEDACQAHGAWLAGQRVGSFGDAAAFSFYPAKNLGAYGDGGILVTNNDEVAQAARLLRNYGSKVKYEHLSIGFNRRLDTLQAGILRVKLRHLDKWNDRRRTLAALYNQALAPLPLELPDESATANSVFHLYVVRSRQRNALQDWLAGRGISTGIHYPIPIHLQPAYRTLGYAPGDFPVTEKAAGEILSLPLYPELDRDSCLRVAHELTAFHNNRMREYGHAAAAKSADLGD